MRNLRVDYTGKKIIMSRTFAALCENPRSEAYVELQRVRADYPMFEVAVHHNKKNPNKESFRGLTYAYMEKYIAQCESPEEIMEEYAQMRLLAECHSVKYQAIKRWFLDRFPEVREFRLKDDMCPPNVINDNSEDTLHVA